MPKPKWIKSKDSFYDPNTDTIYAPDSIGEFYLHELFHARPDTILLNELKPYYENLNDNKLLNMGADLKFIKRTDPNHFFQPEELGARVAVARKILKDVDINEEFLNNLRKNENKYGDNVRDLLKMFNNENLIQILNMKKQLISKNQLGGPIARLAQPTNNKGSWGNRGPGNEGQSFIENALYTIGDLGGLLTVGDKLLHPEKYEAKTDYGTPAEIDGKTVYPLYAPEQEQIGYPTLIPGLKGVPTKELTEFFKTQWGPAYNSLASTKSRLLKLGRPQDLTASKPYIAFQKLNEQLKQMVTEANRNFKTVLLKGRKNAHPGQTSLSKTITKNGMKAASDKAANLTKRQNMQHKAQTAATTGDMRVHNVGIGTRAQRAQWDEVNKIIQNTSSKLWTKILKSQDNLSRATDPKQAEQIQTHINNLYKEFFDKYPGYDTRFNYVYNKVTK